jgi:hypothetical protein
MTTPEQNTPTKDPPPTSTAMKKPATRSHHRKTSAPGVSTSGSGVSARKTPVEPKDVAPKPVYAAGISDKRVKLLTENIAGAYGTVGVLVASRNSYDGMVLLSGAYARAEEIVNVASHNKRAFELLERLFAQGDVMKLVVGHGAMLYAIMVNHDRIPANPVLLQQFGYLPEQLLKKFESASHDATAANGANSHQPAEFSGLPEAELAAR